jgi:hypothetical protein
MFKKITIGICLILVLGFLFYIDFPKEEHVAWKPEVEKVYLVKSCDSNKAYCELDDIATGVQKKFYPSPDRYSSIVVGRTLTITKSGAYQNKEYRKQ